MANTLDFNKIKKKYLTVTLSDEKQTVIMIGTPTKAIMDELMSLQTTISGMTGDATEEAMDELYEVCAKLMSRNKTGKVIEKKLLENIFDFEDIIIFFNAYMEFIGTLSNQKN